MIVHDGESSAGRRVSCNLIPYVFRKSGKLSQSVSSAAVLIGALRVILNQPAELVYTQESNKKFLI